MWTRVKWNKKKMKKIKIKTKNKRFKSRQAFNLYQPSNHCSALILYLQTVLVSFFFLYLYIFNWYYFFLCCHVVFYFFLSCVSFRVINRAPVNLDKRQRKCVPILFSFSYITLLTKNKNHFCILKASFEYLDNIVFTLVNDINFSFIHILSFIFMRETFRIFVRFKRIFA